MRKWHFSSYFGPPVVGIVVCGDRVEVEKCNYAVFWLREGGVCGSGRSFLVVLGLFGGIM